MYLIFYVYREHIETKLPNLFVFKIDNYKNNLLEYSLLSRDF